MPLENYIISVFCLIDDLYKSLSQESSIRSRGYEPVLSDSETITMLIIGEHLGLADNKKIWLEFSSSYLDLFPQLRQVKYKIFNKQATNLWYIMRILHAKLLKQIGSFNQYITDGFPLPVCHYARAYRCKLFKDKVSFGYCAAKQERYYGFKILLVTTDSGIPLDYVIDSANTDERELLLRADIPENTIVIGDKGFIGQEFAQNFKQCSKAQIITPKRSNMKSLSYKANRIIAKIRKRIETTISQLVGTYNIATTKARSYHGLLGRINRKILSFTTALFFNYQIVKDRFNQLELLIKN